MYTPVPPSPLFLERFLEVLYCHSVKHSAIRPGSPHWYQTDVLSASISFWDTGRSHREPNQGSAVGGGWKPFYISPETAGWERKCETGRCHGEGARSILAKFRGDVCARFHAVAAKHRNRTQNSQLGLLGTVLRATTTATYMAARVRNILDTTSYTHFVNIYWFVFINL
jgi:hypothetical protein